VAEREELLLASEIVSVTAVGVRSSVKGIIVFVWTADMALP
jgi:hypothetical protein